MFTLLSAGWLLCFSSSSECSLDKGEDDWLVVAIQSYCLAA